MEKYICKQCNGQGYTLNGDKKYYCKECAGTGVINEESTNNQSN